MGQDSGTSEVAVLMIRELEGQKASCWEMRGLLDLHLLHKEGEWSTNTLTGSVSKNSLELVGQSQKRGPRFPGNCSTKHHPQSPAGHCKQTWNKVLTYLVYLLVSRKRVWGKRGKWKRKYSNLPDHKKKKKVKKYPKLSLNNVVLLHINNDRECLWCTYAKQTQSN